ncbi:MAG: hypothetical protein IH968_05715 [Gemmatimonadetes bacterium]|nr:hypothetical protein [Gemmatimonadota bacterium]
MPEPSDSTLGSPQNDMLRAVIIEDEIHLHVPYPSPLLARVRALPQRRWDRELRVWRVPDSPACRAALRDLLGIEHFGVAPGTRADPFPTPDPAFLPRPTKPAVPRKVLAQIERFDEEMRLRGYALRTRKAYRAHARRFLQDVGENADLAEGGAADDGVVLEGDPLNGWPRPFVEPRLQDSPPKREGVAVELPGIRPELEPPVRCARPFS